MADVEQFPPVGQVAPLAAEREKSVPVPASGTVCGLSEALSVMVTAAARLPDAAGVKLTLTVQLAPAATLVPQVLLSLKSPLFVPVMAILEIVRVAVPLFVSVTFAAALPVPTS